LNRKTNNSDGVKASSQGDDNRVPPTAAVNAGINNPSLSSASGNQNVKPSAIPNGGVQKSWSNVVSSHYGQPAVQQNGAEAQAQNQVVKHENVNHGQVNNQNHDSNNKRQNRPKKSGNKFEEKKGKPDEADNFNPDEKIQAIQNQLDKTLNDMQAKADRVKQLQEQIKTIRAERDGKIDELNTERANIVEDLKKLNNELSETSHQISTIITTMNQHKTNRIQKVRSLVDHSRSLLNDKAI
jgi:chromosome segregation ATPase